MNGITRRLFLAGSSTWLFAKAALANNDYDVVVYGFTGGGIAAAFQAASMGKRVALVGGWREVHLGGMISGGLGSTDVVNPKSCGGLARHVITLINNLSGVADTGFDFEPRYAEEALIQFLSQANITIYKSLGVKGAYKEANRIKSIQTFDGLILFSKVFIDASYEGDLLAAVDVSYTVGREESNKRNILNGFRGNLLSDKSSGHNFYSPYLSGLLTGERISPFRIAYQPESGLLPGVRYSNSAIGDSDHLVQAYNFRMTLTNDKHLMAPLFEDAPPSFNPNDYELLLRWLELLESRGAFAKDDIPLRKIFILSEVGPKVFDANNNGPVSTDLIGGSWKYPTASNSDREVIWKEHEKWTRGLFHILHAYKDSRVPEILRSSAREFSLDTLHYNDPHPNDSRNWPYQLYVREARRLVSDFVLDGWDVARSARDEQRSNKTIAIGSYNRDSHHVQRLAVSASGWLPGSTEVYAWNEGNIEVPSGGSDELFAVPYEVVVPKSAECANLLVAFCVSATHEAFGAVRMELTLMQIGQACGAAAALVASSGSTVQQVPYDEVVDALARQKLGPPSVLAFPGSS